jgi:predicted O-methyltransferase YrrM
MEITPQETFASCINPNNVCDVSGHVGYLREVAKGNILEIGVRGGGSTSAFLCGLEEHGGHLFSVDIEPSCGAKFDGHPQWTFINLDSVSAESLVTDKILHHLGFADANEGMLKPRVLDVLFIDGDHTFGAVLSDLTMYSPLVKKGGLILMHDVCEGTLAGVREAMDVFLKNTGWEHEIHTQSHGLGIIKVP